MGGMARMALLAGTGAAGIAVARWALAQRRSRVARYLVEEAIEPTQRIVVLGAGFGGLYAAIRMADAVWDDPGVEVLLIDRHNYHLFTPMLTLVAGSAIEPRSVAFPVRRLLRDHHLAFRRAEVQSIDVPNRKVTTDTGPVHFDKLVLALGSVANYFGMREVQEQAFTFKSIADALAIRNHIVDCFERAALTKDPAERRQLLTFVIVGGGPTGVELASALHDFIHHTLVDEYPNLSFQREVRMVLLEMKGRVLPNLQDDLARVAARTLRLKAVDLRLNTALDRAMDGKIVTKEGEEIPTRTLVWVAGVQASPIVSRLDVEQGRAGSVVVDEYLRVSTVPGLYALGDAAAYTDPESGRPLPADAKVAIQQAIAVANNVIRELRGEEPRPFKYRYFGDMVSLGTSAAVAEVLGFKLTGHLAWFLWRTYYLGRLHGVESKSRVLADWVLDTFLERYTAQLELE